MTSQRILISVICSILLCITHKKSQAVERCQNSIQSTDTTVYDSIQVSSIAHMNITFEEYLRNQLRFPVEAKEWGPKFEVKLIFSFVVEIDGSISYLTLEKIDINSKKKMPDNIKDALSIEARSTILKTSYNWIPATFNQSKVRSRTTRAITFKIL